MTDDPLTQYTVELLAEKAIETFHQDACRPTPDTVRGIIEKDLEDHDIDPDDNHKLTQKIVNKAIDQLISLIITEVEEYLNERQLERDDDQVKDAVYDVFHQNNIDPNEHTAFYGSVISNAKNELGMTTTTRDPEEEDVVVGQRVKMGTDASPWYTITSVGRYEGMLHFAGETEDGETVAGRTRGEIHKMEVSKVDLWEPEFIEFENNWPVFDCDPCPCCGSGSITMQYDVSAQFDGTKDLNFRIDIPNELVCVIWARCNGCSTVLHEGER
jgi:hypothetical protein